MPGSGASSTFLGMEQKIVILHGFSPEEAVAILKAVKTTVPGAADAAFATSTETSLDWKLSYLVEHITEEHRQFREMRTKSAN